MTVSDKIASIAKLIDILNWSAVVALILFIISVIIVIILTTKMKRKTFFVISTIVLIVIFAALLGTDMKEHNQYNAYNDQVKYFYQRTNIQPQDSENMKLSTFEGKLQLIHNDDVKIIKKIQQKQKQQENN